MQSVDLGRTGLRVSKLCFGTLTMSPLQKNLSPEEGAKLLLHAYERGVNFLDTADLYGTYPHIRRALRVAPDYIVSTKAYCYDEKTAREALERAYTSLMLVKDSIEQGMPEDFFSIDLSDAYSELGRIVGEAVGDDVVNEIFSRFCMGK